MDALTGLDEKLRIYEDSCQHLIRALVSSMTLPCISIVVFTAVSERGSDPHCLQEALKAEDSQPTHATHSAGQ